jgi:hypothetical protein
MYQLCLLSMEVCVWQAKGCEMRPLRLVCHGDKPDEEECYPLDVRDEATAAGMSRDQLIVIQIRKF